MKKKIAQKSRRIHELSRHEGVFVHAMAHTDEDGEIDTKVFPLRYLDLRLGQ
jgi:hypothetical protein